MTTPLSPKSRSFCPLILYHDKPSKELSLNLNAKRQENRSAIDRHLERTNEMLLQNAQFWSEKPGLESDEPEDLSKEIRVTPSTSTNSNASFSSSSSGDSIATVDTYQRQSNTYNESHEMSGVYSTPLENASETSKKKRRGNLPKEVTEYLRTWLLQHKRHPYPSEKEKADLAHHTGLTVNQISNWFINARRRILQPMLESEQLCAQMMAYPEMMVYDTRHPRTDYYPYPQQEYPSIEHPVIHHYPVDPRFMMYHGPFEYMR